MAGKQDGGREAVSWLATGFVFLLGILFCGFIVLAFANEPKIPILVLSGVFLTLAVLLWLFREKPRKTIEEHEARWFGIFSKPKITISLKLTRHKKPKIVQFGTNQPPTVEGIREIRELTDGMKNWVPPKTDPQHEPKP